MDSLGLAAVFLFSWLGISIALTSSWSLSSCVQCAVCVVFVITLGCLCQLLLWLASKDLCVVHLECDFLRISLAQFRCMHVQKITNHVVREGIHFEVAGESLRNQPIFIPASSQKSARKSTFEELTWELLLSLLTYSQGQVCDFPCAICSVSKMQHIR